MNKKNLTNEIKLDLVQCECNYCFEISNLCKCDTCDDHYCQDPCFANHRNQCSVCQRKCCFNSIGECTKCKKVVCLRECPPSDIWRDCKYGYCTKCCLDAHGELECDECQQGLCGLEFTECDFCEQSFCDTPCFQRHHCRVKKIKIGV